MLFIYKWGHIISAEPASACKSFARQSEGMDPTQVSPSGSCIPGGTDIWTGTSETSPETEPPQEKKAKKEAGKEELEEGELTDSSDEEEVVEGNTVQNNPCNKGCDGAKSPADDMDFTEDELADSADKVVDDSNNKPSDSSRDQCINKDITGSTDENIAVSESVEISVTKEDALKESGSVPSHLC